MTASANLPEPAPWLSTNYKRWQKNKPMTTARQKELIEEYVSTLGSLPGGTNRATVAAEYSLQRDNRVRLAPSSTIPQLTGVFLQPNVLAEPRSLLLNYRGWVLTEAEYERFGYAVHTAVYFPGAFADNMKKYVLVGDPTAPGPQINCVKGTSKHPNVQLVVSNGATAGAGPNTPDSSITVRAVRKLKPGEELWLDYGANYWEHMSLYCPHCLEFGADEKDCMLICEIPGCKRAWHQLCMQPCLVEVPDGPFYCDIHARKS